MNASTQTIQNEPAIKNLLSRMPNDVANSFSEEQLTHLLTAIGARSWGRHKVDLRGTIKVPLYRWRFYYVLLLGKNIRELSRKEQQISLMLFTLMTAMFLLFSTLVGLLVIYLIKSAAGIDIFPGFSFGIWDWFKS